MKEINRTIKVLDNATGGFHLDGDRYVYDHKLAYVNAELLYDSAKIALEKLEKCKF